MEVFQRLDWCYLWTFSKNWGWSILQEGAMSLLTRVIGSIHLLTKTFEKKDLWYESMYTVK
jgi:hypothetical protein